MRLLDLFCGAGGAGMGYSRAGFDVVGVDIEPQPHYPFSFVLSDALDLLARMLRGEKLKASDGNWYGVDDFEAIHASPPCQGYSGMTKGVWQDRIDSHPKLIPDVRKLLVKTGKPYVIENVEQARKEMINPFLLCGTMFGLETEGGNQLKRHRYFETNAFFPLVRPCRHNKYSVIGVYGGGQSPARRRRNPKVECAEIDFGIKARSAVMGIDWMIGSELNEAIPPAYTEFIGKQLIAQLEAQS